MRCTYPGAVCTCYYCSGLVSLSSEDVLRTPISRIHAFGRVSSDACSLHKRQFKLTQESRTAKGSEVVDEQGSWTTSSEGSDERSSARMYTDLECRANLVHNKVATDHKMHRVQILQVLGLAVAVIFCAQTACAQGSSQSGFISIDCGATSAYTDTKTGINWVPDTNYTSLGKSFTNVPGSSVYEQVYSTLRYFDEPRGKYCYVLPGTVVGMAYMIRYSFWYGSYDNAATKPSFNVSIDATIQWSFGPTDFTNTNTLQYETLYVATKNTIDFCLIRDQTGGSNPFISSLELRTFDAGSYSEPSLLAGNFYQKLFRYNIGGSVDVRYPDDEYDRIWSAYNDSTLTPLVSPTPVLNSKSYYLKPPSAVMQSGQTSSTTITTSLTMLFTSITSVLGSASLTSLMQYYFADLDALANATSRSFNIIMGGFVPTYVNPYNDTGGAFRADLFYFDNYTLDSSFKILLQPTTQSARSPILNGLELHVLYPLTFATPTYNADALAITAIRMALNLTLSSGGDPCLPVPIEWVTCSLGAVPRVTKITLSSYNLTGEIPAVFANLTALTSLFLDDNYFMGTIPDLSALQNLISLHLQHNRLSGTIPTSLGTIPTLKEIFLQDNNLTGSVPSTLTKPGLTINVTGNPGLTGSTPPSSLSPPQSSNQTTSTNVGVIAGAVGGGVAALLLIVGLVVLCMCRKQPKKSGPDIISSQNPAMPYGNGNGGSTAPKQGANEYTIAELASATNNFKTKIGEGGFGPVYYGKLANGQEVAVKVSDANSRQGAQEFNNEVELLSRVHHKNLVSLIGYCQEDNRQMLVYEFLHKGTVREHLYGSDLAIHEPLNWRARLDIALNSAQGLEYLHTGCNPCIIHRDIKSSNILLTNKFVAKVADFGLSKLAPEEGATHVSTVVKGTAGYLDPEYWQTNSLTERSDVYSFGVVLLELICGRAPIDNTLPDRSHWNINERVRKSLEVGNIEDILDPSIKKLNPNMESVWKVAELAIHSVEPRGVHRPFMRDVVRELREACDLEMVVKQTYSSTSNSDGHGSINYYNHAPMASQPPSNKFDDSVTFMGDPGTSYPHPR